MNCPHCDSPARVNQKFCKSCGTRLVDSSALITSELTEQAPIIEKRVPNIVAGSREPKIIRWGWLSMMSGMIFCSLIVLSWALKDFYPGLAKLIAIYSTLIGTALLVIGMSIIMYQRTIKGPTREDLSESKPTALPVPRQVIDLPEERFQEPVPSVTERTTNLLDEADSRSGENYRVKQGQMD